VTINKLNWSSSSNNPTSLNPAIISCTDVDIYSNICFDGSNHKITIINKGTDITRILLRNQNDDINYLIPSSTVQSSKTKLFVVSQEDFNDPNMKIIPVIIYNNNELVCISEAVIKNNIPSC